MLRFIALACALSFPLAAIADQADKDACADLEEGDECTRGDGDPGTCIPDESDPDVLTCDDDASADGSSSSGCNAGGAAPGGAGLAVLAVALAVTGHRRRARHGR